MTKLHKHQANSNSDCLLIQALFNLGIDPQLLESFMIDSIDVARSVHNLRDETVHNTSYATTEFINREIKLTKMEILLTRLQNEMLTSNQ